MIILINPDKTVLKKKHDKACRVMRHLNFGILAMASKYPEETIIYDCQGKESSDAVKDLVKLVRHHAIKAIGISLISGYSEEYVTSMARELKNRISDIPIILGGKDHARHIARDLLSSNYFDAVAQGDGELFVDELLRNNYEYQQCGSTIYRSNGGEILTTKATTMAMDKIPHLEHSLYPEFRGYVPAIEVSRGCPRKCAFCSNSTRRHIKKNVNDIICEAERIKSLYQVKEIPIYFETPCLSMAKDDLLSIARHRCKSDYIWRAQTRVEYLNPHTLELLYNAGARVIDVGLESGSERILNNMEKCKNPKLYLAQAREALSVAQSLGIRMKLNIMLYAGETKGTIGETMEFLANNLHGYHSISAYPLVLFPSDRHNEFRNSIIALGGVLRPNSSLCHITPLDLSKDITLELSQEICLLLGKAFQSKTTFLNERSIAYYPHGIDKDLIETNDLPCYSDESERRNALNELEYILRRVE